MPKATPDLLHNVIEDIASIVFRNAKKENPAIQLLKQRLSETENALNNLLRAIEEGIITAGSMLKDTYLTNEELRSTGYTETPANWYTKQKGDYGQLTVRQAIRTSSNLTVIRAVNQLGVEKAFEYGQKLGLGLSESDKGVAPLALGEQTYGTTPLKMAAAFGTFGNQGMYTEPRLYTKVVDRNGATILESTTTSHKVFSEAELKSRCEIMLDNYCKTVVIEASTMVDMARTEIAPAIENYVCELAKTVTAKRAVDAALVCSFESGLVKKLSMLTDTIAVKAEELENALEELNKAEDIIMEANMIRDVVLALMDELRFACDEAETVTAKKFWPFPTYGDLLFGVK